MGVCSRHVGSRSGDFHRFRLSPGCGLCYADVDGRGLPILRLQSGGRRREARHLDIGAEMRRDRVGGLRGSPREREGSSGRPSRGHGFLDRRRQSQSDPCCNRACGGFLSDLRLYGFGGTCQSRCAASGSRARNGNRS